VKRQKGGMILCVVILEYLLLQSYLYYLFF